ncbi:MAG: hypothetical protein M1821_008716 [Bathelium mastoideum]|nr:MAG: hypothetical protein M1821_008716 [Bathelium mastoideum]KAI9685876.1 MAG: hypothetical protein M1822_004154 [Bathelium mastoideum]
MNRPTEVDDDDFDYGTDREDEEPRQASAFTEDDMKTEEEEIRELERKKQALEDRVTEMEKDLGGLMR